MSSVTERAIHTINARKLPPHIRDTIPETMCSTNLNEQICQFPSCGRVLRKGTKTAFEHVCQHLSFKPYECACGQKFQHYTSAQRHCNTQESSFSCDNCGRAFRRKDARNTHRLRCHFDTSMPTNNLGRNSPADSVSAASQNSPNGVLGNQLGTVTGPSVSDLSVLDHYDFTRMTGNHCESFPIWSFDKWSNDAIASQLETVIGPSVPILGPYDLLKNPDFQELFRETINY